MTISNNTIYSYYKDYNLSKKITKKPDYQSNEPKEWSKTKEWIDEFEKIDLLLNLFICLCILILTLQL